MILAPKDEILSDAKRSPRGLIKSMLPKKHSQRVLEHLINRKVNEKNLNCSNPAYTSIQV